MLDESVHQALDLGDLEMEHPTAHKINSRDAPVGLMGEKYLASGSQVGLRLWIEEESKSPKPATRRDYETIGLVISGHAELELEGETIRLDPGDSWVVPKGSLHSYTIRKSFIAVEATSPPARVHLSGGT